MTFSDLEWRHQICIARYLCGTAELHVRVKGRRFVLIGSVCVSQLCVWRLCALSRLLCFNHEPKHNGFKAHVSAHTHDTPQRRVDCLYFGPLPVLNSGRPRWQGFMFDRHQFAVLGLFRPRIMLELSALVGLNLDYCGCLALFGLL